MKKFTQLALVSSIAISANAMAMQAMDDAALSASTGQDGINIGIGISKVTIDKLYIHDNDGLAAKGTAGTDAGSGGTGAAGAIVIKGNGTGATTTSGIVITAPMNAAGTAFDTSRMLASHNLADLQIDSDAGTGANGAFINIAAQVSGLDIYIGEIGVTGSGTAGAGDNKDTIRRGGTSNYNAILSGLTLKTGPMSANIQLGAAPQGAMIKLNTTMIGGLEIQNLGILDNSTKLGTGDGLTAANRAAGVIHLDSIKVANAGKTDLDIKSSINVYGASSSTDKGYIRIVNEDTGGIDNYVRGVHLGSATAGSIGDIEIQGLQTYYFNGTNNVAGSVLTVSGR